MKIAILTEGHPTFTKGIASYVNEKSRRFKALQDDTLIVDSYMLRSDYTPFLKWLLKQKGCNVETFKRHEEKCIVGDVEYNCIWHTIGICDLFLYSKLGIDFLRRKFRKKIAPILASYDVICTHKTDCHVIGAFMWKHYNIPYVATWHGSDINVHPYENKMIRKSVIETIENAGQNLFVSEALMKASEKLTDKGSKDVIYTGAAAHFEEYSEEKKRELKKKKNVKGCKVVSFTGNLIPVKNVMVLPEIFAAVDRKYKKERVKFWIVGNGYLEKDLKEALEREKLDFTFLGKVQQKNMPDIYNCVDVNVLPSVNEGFSLVNVEARSCGVNVVGSRIGGIPESIGQDENCFDLDDKFIDRISNRIVDILKNGEKPKPLSEEFSWDYAVQKELKICKVLTEMRK